ncbi:MAG TPA: 3-hydroxyacyl-CoA dehydrogenase NAD-binding domain-containing protein, partial [Anaeromyxobacteraceae bacterium]
MIVRTVGIVGAGDMGQGIAVTCAAAGLDVLLKERTPGAGERALLQIAESLDRDIARWSRTESEKKAVLARIRKVDAVEEVAAAQIVVEAVREDLELKAAIFQDL